MILFESYTPTAGIKPYRGENLSDFYCLWKQTFFIMALTKEQKQKAIKDLKDKISQQKSAIFIDFSKVNSKDIFALRKKLKTAGCVMKVAKKTLLDIAFGKDNEIWGKAKENIPGQLAVVFGIKDEIAPAK